MIRGTTPTLEFTLPFNQSDVEQVGIVFAQCRKVILIKTMDNCMVTDDDPELVLKLKLTKAETLKFTCGREVEMQLIVDFVNGDTVVSEIFTDDMDHSLWDGVIYEV